MPRIVDHLVALEAADMVGHHGFVEQHDEAFSMAAHQHHPTGGAGIDAVAIVIRRDQAGRGRPHRLLDKAVERRPPFHQARAFFLEDLPDRPVLELRMPCPLCVGDALVFQPAIQFGQAADARLGSEQLITQVADLVLDLTLLPTRGRAAGHRLDQMMRAHLQEPPIVLPRLADEDRLDRRLHVVVDAAPTGPAIKGEGPVVGIEHQFLRLAEVGPHKGHPAVRQLHVRRLDHQRQALQRDRLVAPVELIGLPRRKAHRHKRLCRNPRSLLPPLLHEPMNAVVRTIIATAAQLLEQPLRRPPLTLRQPRFRLHDLPQRTHPLAKLRRRLNLSRILERGPARAHHLAHRRARYPQLPRDLLDRPPLLEKRPPYLPDKLHANHPRQPFQEPTKAQKEATLAQPTGGSELDAKTTPQGVTIARDFTIIGSAAPTAAPCWRLTWEGWRAGVVPVTFGQRLAENDAIPLSPALAAAACAAEAFAFHAADHPMAGRRAAGLSLWQPGRNWLDPDPTESALAYLPSRLWLIGLGNLAQAFAWLLALLPYEDTSKVELLLHDFDHMALSNDSTSLLSFIADVGRKKTRVVSKWLEDRGFNTVLEERRFGSWTRRAQHEPAAALCGVDNALARAGLDQAGFELVVEAGLGAGPQSFRSMSIHTFPASRSSADLWSQQVALADENFEHMPAYQALKKAGIDECGLTQLASRTVGVPFVGLIAGCLVVAELLRRLNGGVALEFASGSAAALEDIESGALQAPPYACGHLPAMGLGR